MHENFYANCVGVVVARYVMRVILKRGKVTDLSLQNALFYSCNDNFITYHLTTTCVGLWMLRCGGQHKRICQRQIPTTPYLLSVMWEGNGLHFGRPFCNCFGVLALTILREPDC